MWTFMAKYTLKPRVMQTNLFDLHCRGATGYVTEGQISQKPNGAVSKWIFCNRPIRCVRMDKM